MGIGAIDGQVRERVWRWVRLGFLTGFETVQYTVIIVFLGVVTTVADQGSLTGTDQGSPVLLDIVDVEFVSTAIGTQLGTQTPVMVMGIAILTIATMTGVGVALLHGATIPVHTPQREYVFTLPDLSVLGYDLAPVLVAVPVAVIVAHVAQSGIGLDDDRPPTTLAGNAATVGVAHAITVVATALIARELLFAFLTATAGPAATAGVSIPIVSIPVVGVVTVFAVVFVLVGLGVGAGVRSVDTDALW